jgi:hypothetical protein
MRRIVSVAAAAVLVLIGSLFSIVLMAEAWIIADVFLALGTVLCVVVLRRDEPRSASRLCMAAILGVALFMLAAVNLDPIVNLLIEWWFGQIDESLLSSIAW